jgi:ABC-2 type transport system permease protein
MYSLILKQFLRSRTALITLSLILAIGIVSILIGKQFLAKQEGIIANVTQHQHDHIERNVALHDEMGLLLYYLRFSLIDQPDKLSALSIGQRDITPSIQSVTIRTLEAQKYDTDLNNPSALQSGNLDLGFVIIYLFPLVIIALTFNLVSEEHEGGTWRMVAVQSKSVVRFLLHKLFVRAGMIYASLAILFLIAIMVLALPVNMAFLGFIVLSVLYVAFWFAFCFWIISFQKNSSFNALTLLSVWIMLAILIPASVNNYVANQYPVPEALSAMVEQRDGYHEKWDIDRKVTMNKFYEHYPEFKKYGVPDAEFSWLWYYAMQQMGDDESAQQSKAMQEKIMLREQTSRSVAVIIPTMHTQLLLNDLARTSLSDHLALLNKTNEFHEKLRLHFYPKIFDETSVKDEGWNAFKPEYLVKQSNINWSMMVLPLFFLIAAISVLTFVNVRKLGAV